ncbi:SPFH domain-containing protein [Citroniella saccharovorans]|uniref:SPFH domain-containing protein n=1 Tax=Citroniella saccharovorans TaxID=2053367 RepID=A0AAW9MTB7_9FIRM|nr:SPFH domain-containing protein [Citroniella saccharovorans]MEB3429301.1 SPFH domain-containing protein [Citroniella saccharovorans]
MGFIKAFTGALSGSFADQWLDFYGPGSLESGTLGIFPAKPQGQNKGRGENTKGNNNIISNGSKILVPEATALITMQDGMITGIVNEPGGFIYSSDDVNSQSIFAGDGLTGSLIKSTWEKIKFGGQPGSEQLAFYVNLKEIPKNRFGTQSEIYWDDAFFGTQVGAVTRGTYTLKIVDPLLFVRNFVPQKYLVPNAPAFDFQDMDNEAAEELFNEVVSSLSAAFSNYTNDPSKGNRMSKIQGDQIGFAKSLSTAVEDGYEWKSTRGLEIAKTAILAIEYDEDTKALMSDVKKADALSSTRGNSFFQQAAARGIEAAGENGGGANMAFMGMGMNAAGNMMGAVQQENTGNSYNPNFAAGNPNPAPNTSQEDPTEKLINMKKLLDAGVITQEEFDKVKKDLLGL